jgi:hypothetical protein
MKCLNCNTKLGTGDAPPLCSTCQERQRRVREAPIGWRCPVCGCGNAPWKDSCDCGKSDSISSASVWTLPKPSDL